MGRPGPNCKKRICKLCGQEFIPSSSHQSCCNREIEVACIICGTAFKKRCTTSDATKTCSESCFQEYLKIRRKENAQLTTKVCKCCGKKFHPTNARVVFCDGPHFKNCVICGTPFEFDPRKNPDTQTCSKGCFVKLQLSHRDIDAEHEKMKQVLLAKYGVDNPAKIPGAQEKAKQTSLKKYGSEWYTQTEEYHERSEATSLEKYGSKHWLSTTEVIQKREATCLEKYGATNVFGSEYGKSKVTGFLKENYGVVNPSQVPEFRKKAMKNSRKSSLESRVSALLDEYSIEYVQHHSISNIEEKLFHEFDFFLPKYKILVDCDGIYFHSYLNDPDGKHVLDYYDETRLALIPEGYIFHVIVEGQEDKDIKRLADTLKEIDSNVFDYEGEIFRWCRSIEFPYPQYTDSRMKSDFNSLCKYEYSEYKPTARLGESVCRHFHRSLYSAHVDGFVSPVEAWYDDTLLKKVIRNRLIYKNDVDPSKILSGFNISKICPRVSMFNPVLAKYLVRKYLSEFKVVFDPFSGFSGRMLGVVACGKAYQGQDLNETAVKESNQIIEFLNLSRCVVNRLNILDCKGIYECILTCPPYGSKEHYSDEDVIKSCDEWIEEILQRFDCSRYVFVVDTTEKYRNFVKEEIASTSHFSKVKEFVIVIDR